MTTDTDSPSPFTVVGAAVYDAATDELEPLDEPNRWEPAPKLESSFKDGGGYLRYYRETL